MSTNLTNTNWFVYIIQNPQGILYTGITTNIEKRLTKHNKGTGAKFTRGKGLWILIRSFSCSSKSEALKLEYHIKGLSKNDKLNFTQKSTD